MMADVDPGSGSPSVATSGEPTGPRLAMRASVRAEQARRTERLLLLAIRLLYVVLLVTVSLLPFVGTITEADPRNAPSFADYIGPFLATLALGVVVVLVDTATPNKRLSAVFGVYLGIVAGLVGALAIGALLDLVADSWELNTTKAGQAYLGLAKLAIGITLCYLAVSIVLTTKDDFRLVIPYVEFSKQVRGVRPLLLDTSVLIDGRVEGLGQSGFLDAPLVVPQFVIDELQTLADSNDRLKRARGRRGLSMVSTLQDSPFVDVSIDDTEIPGHSVDHKLLRLASDHSQRILTTDYNLNKVGQIQSVTVLNLNDLTNLLRGHAIPGQAMEVEVVKPGEGPGQGVGYLPDGTMVVIEEAAGRIGQTVSVVVTNSLQTSAGRMIFGRLVDAAPGKQQVDDPTSATDAMTRAATQQPRVPSKPPERARAADSRRNPRR